MKVIKDRPLSQHRRQWMTPSVKRMSAGSAENDVGPSTDLAVNS